MRHPYFAETTGPRILAHRGLVPAALGEQGVAENTRVAFQSAIDAGARYLETDCHLTSDGEVVLFHDPDLSRVLGDPRAVAEVSSSELAALMIDRGGLLTLEQLLDEFPSARFNIDIKAAAAADPAGHAIAPHANRVLIAGFNDEYRLRALRAASARNALAATSPGRNALIRLLIALATRSRRRIDRAFAGLDAVQIPERRGWIKILSRRLIDEAHERGVEVHVWTVNDATEMRRLVGFGVDGIITDRTDLAVEALRRPGAP